VGLFNARVNHLNPRIKKKQKNKRNEPQRKLIRNYRACVQVGHCRIIYNTMRELR